MKKLFFYLLVFCTFPVILFSQSRTEIHIPDLPGYLTLKCDFHMHTVFSDGAVWPTVRVNEAWQQGLDAIAITEHIEYRPHLEDIKSDHNRSYEIAKPLADKLDVILIRGTEITKNMPPGHFNALFINNANLIERENWLEALREANEQGAFIIWNHPGWKSQQPEKTLWWSHHTRLYEEGILRGIEVYNEFEYYPEAVKWAHEKGLTMFANSDVHGSVFEYYGHEKTAPHRPLTLVFATEKKTESIKYALENQRTAVYFDGKLIGEGKFLLPIFYESIMIKNDYLRLKYKDSKYVQVYNNSDIDYHLKSISNSNSGFSFSNNVVLKSKSTSLIEVIGISEEINFQSKIKLPYEISNLTNTDGEKIKVEIEVVNF